MRLQQNANCCKEKEKKILGLEIRILFVILILGLFLLYS